MLAQSVVGKLATLRSLKFLATCGFQNRAAHLYDVGYVLCLEVDNLVGYQAPVAAVYTLYAETAEDGRAGDGSDSGIHSGSVASRGKDAYGFNCWHGCVSFLSNIGLEKQI